MLHPCFTCAYTRYAYTTRTHAYITKQSFRRYRVLSRDVQTQAALEAAYSATFASHTRDRPQCGDNSPARGLDSIQRNRRRQPHRESVACSSGESFHLRRAFYEQTPRHAGGFKGAYNVHAFSPEEVIACVSAPREWELLRHQQGRRRLRWMGCARNRRSLARDSNGRGRGRRLGSSNGEAGERKGGVFCLARPLWRADGGHQNGGGGGFHWPEMGPVKARRRPRTRIARA